MYPYFKIKSMSHRLDADNHTIKVTGNFLNNSDIAGEAYIEYLLWDKHKSRLLDSALERRNCYANHSFSHSEYLQIAGQVPDDERVYVEIITYHYEDSEPTTNTGGV